MYVFDGGKPVVSSVCVGSLTMETEDGEARIRMTMGNVIMPPPPKNIIAADYFHPGDEKGRGFERRG